MEGLKPRMVRARLDWPRLGGPEIAPRWSVRVSSCRSATTCGCSPRRYSPRRDGAKARCAPSMRAASYDCPLARRLPWSCGILEVWLLPFQAMRCTMQEESCNTRSLLGQRLQGGRVAGMLVYIYIYFFYISGMLHAVGGQEDKTADQVAHVDYAVYLVRPYAA